MIKPSLSLLLLYIYLFIVAVLVTVPTGVIDVATNEFYVGGTLRLDHLLHALMFIPFVPLWRAGRPDHPWWLIIGAGLLFAACCELLHLVLPYRGYGINDLLGNVAGVIAGTGLAAGFSGKHILKRN